MHAYDMTVLWAGGLWYGNKWIELNNFVSVYRGWPYPKCPRI